MGIRHWVIAIALALGLHAMALTWHGGTSQSSYGAVAAGEDGIEVGLGMEGSYADLLQTPEENIEEPQIEEPVEQKQEPEPTPEPVPEPPPPVADIPVDPVEPAPQEEQFSAAKLEETTPADETPTETTEKDVSEQQPDEQVEKKTVASLAAVSSVQATGRAQQTETGGKVGSARDYFAEMMAWLNQYKHYPADAKKSKQQGIVSVQFTLNQAGDVIARTIKKSSGHALLDQAALAMFDAATPLPAIPEFMQRETLTVVLPIDFSLITNHAFKE